MDTDVRRGWWRIGNAVFPQGSYIGVVSRSTDKLDVFRTDVNGNVITAAWEPAFTDGWHGWWSLNGGMAAHGSIVTADSRRPDFMDVFVIGMDGRAWSAAWSPGNPWAGWWPMGK